MMSVDITGDMKFLLDRSTNLWEVVNMNEKEIERVDLDIAKIQQLLKIEVKIRDGILSKILETYMSDKFSVEESHKARESVSLLKTNSLTDLIKQLHELQTYKNQLVVEDMMKR